MSGSRTIKPIRIVFWALVAVFVLVLGVLFIPAVNEFSRTAAPYGFIALGAIFFLLGAAVLVLTIREKTGGALKKFLLTTGSAAAGLPVFAVLHNVVSALFNTEEPVFFTLAVPVCPLGFIVGATGTIVLMIRGKSSAATTLEGGRP